MVNSGNVKPTQMRPLDPWITEPRATLPSFYLIPGILKNLGVEQLLLYIDKKPVEVVQTSD